MQNSTKEAFDKAQREKENKRKNSQEMPSMEELRRGEINVAEVKQQLLKRYSKEEIDAIIELYASAYGDSGLTAQEVMEEILCDAMGQMNAFATEEMERVAGEVGVFLRNVRKSVRIQEGGKNKSSAQNAESGEVKHSIVETLDGRLVAVVDNDILSQIDTKNWSKDSFEQAKKAASESLKKFKDGVVVNGITRKINRDTRREYTRSNYTEMIKKRNPAVFADKMRFAEVADDVIIASSGWKNDGGLLHKRNDNFVDFDHGNTLLMAGSNKYEAEAVVGITDSGDYVFYDLVDIVPAYFDIKKEESPSTATTDKPIGDIQGDSYDGIITQDVGKFKNKYSLKIDEKYLSAVKSGDMDMEHDDNGEIIPISKRFDTENSDIRYSREMDTVKALERQNALMKERWEYWKGQAQTTKTAKADKAEVRKLARDILRGYSSDTKVEDILPDLQRLANQNDSYSDMVDAAEGIARKIMEGSGVDVNADLAETRERLKKYLRIKWMQAGKL